MNEPRTGFHCCDGISALLIRTKHADENPCRAQVRSDVHMRDAPERKPRVVHFFPNDVGELLSEQLTNLSRTTSHTVSTFTPVTRLGAGDFFAVEELDLVLHLKIVESVESKSALVAGCNFTNVVLEALQRLDRHPRT